MLCLTGKWGKFALVIFSLLDGLLRFSKKAVLISEGFGSFTASKSVGRLLAVCTILQLTSLALSVTHQIAALIGKLKFTINSKSCDVKAINPTD